MARTKDEIKKEMVDAFMADATLQQNYGFDPTKSFAEQFSKVSIENIIFSIVSTAIWVLDCLFDKHQEEVSETISKRAHTLAWYREKALAFQLGYKLSEETADYDNSGLTDEQVEQSKIIAKCACVSSGTTYPTITVKAVKASGKLSTAEMSAFEAYMNEIADAGVKINIVSLDQDILGLTATVWVDPLLIDADGNLYNDGKADVVADYINTYLSSLPYNGTFYPKMLESYLMTQEGVKMVRIDVAKAKYSTGNGTSEETIYDKWEPQSGAITFNLEYEGLGGLIYERL